ncbi:uncharacterized protein LOC120276720 isoform X1 [Dioscorea cayenensis subsp. rotundata]|uniref:Uncharacterized protein LOC120276720 isoform X1 n=1 Tax=Dioscorea cayennensis subsp. rotundata TaxID=55577 RepID=A0AB40CMA2_DIOCR|nr:uncharacterized protein LOC120276720 isoform X1 [Dioscorea cayenensis subsp. rotundata]
MKTFCMHRTMINNNSFTLEILFNKQEGISSPIATEILSLCDDAELFPETLRSSDVSSCSGGADCSGSASGSGAGGTGSLCCYDDTFASTFSPFSSMNASSLSALLETEQPNDQCPASSAFAVLPYIGDQQDPLDQIMLSEAMNSGCYSSSFCSDTVAPPMQLQGLPSVYEDDCLPPLPLAYVGLDAPPSCAFLDPGIGSYYAGNTGMQMPGDAHSFYSGGVMAGSGPARSSSQEMVEYQRTAEGDGVGLFGPEPIQQVFNSGEMQPIADNQHARPTLPATDISVLDDSTFKVGRLSVEERKEKIHRYMKKRNERNFSKKIKYACRKTLADSRPRVRGRFAKNDELGEARRPNSTHHEYEDDEEIMVKEEDMFDSADILAHISGVNSFKYNYTIESWI